MKLTNSKTKQEVKFAFDNLNIGEVKKLKQGQYSFPYCTLKEKDKFASPITDLQILLTIRNDICNIVAIGFAEDTQNDYAEFDITLTPKEMTRLLTTILYRN